MTERLYYHDPTLLSFEAKIVKAEQNEAGTYITVLDKSAFYPTSGGQQFDTGALNNIAIDDVTEDDEVVIHYSQKAVGQVGDNVTGEVNRLRREKHRRLHTAQHIISQALHRLAEHTTVSVHLGDNYGLVEIDNKSVAEDILVEVEQMANQIIREALPITTKFIDSADLEQLPLRKIPKRTGKIRIIQIGEFEYSACGGTHCLNTAEVGLVKLIGIEKVHGNAGIKFLCGLQAFDDYGSRFKITDNLSKKFTCHVDDLPERIDKLDNDNKDLKKTITSLEKELLPVKAAAYALNKEIVDNTALVFEQIQNLQPKSGGQLAIAISELINGTAALVGAQRMIVATQSSDAGMIAKKLSAEFNLKGGGNKIMSQLSGVDNSKIDKYKELVVELIKQ